MLALLSRLKESIGRQRAFLCGSLALPEEAIPGFTSRAFADLVVCVNQQSGYIAQLEDDQLQIVEKFGAHED